MNAEEKIRLVEYIGGVLKYQRQDASEFVLSLWCNAMDKYELPAVTDAITRFIENPDNGQYPMKIADVVKLLMGSSVDTALLAWAKVEKAISSVGSYETVAYDDPVIHAAIDRIGGWVKLALVVEKDMPFKRNEFLAQYKAVKSLPRYDYPPTLTGAHDIENIGKGYKSKPIILIGDKIACQEVIDGGKHGALQITHVSNVASEGVRSLSL